MALGIVIAMNSCSERELLMPEGQVEENSGSLKTRPSLRPDDVQVYPAFYNSVEIVFPREQPERAVKSIITYQKDDGTEARIEVADFDQVISVDNLSLKEHAFKIVYVSVDGKLSNPVVRKAIPYGPAYDYVRDRMQVQASGGQITVKWEKPFAQEMTIKVVYETNGQSYSTEKKTTAAEDQILLDDLAFNTDYIVKVTVLDEQRNASSQELVFNVNSGIPLAHEILAKTAWKISAANGFGFFRVVNASTSVAGDIQIRYLSQDGTYKSRTADGLLNDEKVFFIEDLDGQGDISIQVKTATGEAVKRLETEEQPETLTIIDFGKSYKDTWIATESSFRIAGSGVRYVGQKVLDSKPIPTTSVDNDDIWTNEWSKAPTNAPPHWIAIDFRKPIVITEFKYYYGKDNARPKEVSLQRSSNGSDYQTEESFIDENAFKTYGSYTYNLKKPMHTRYFRMYIPSIYGSTTIRLSEFFFKGVEVPTW